MIRRFFEPIPLTEQTTGRNGLKFGMDAHFGKVFGAIEAFFEFRLMTRGMGYPQGKKFGKINFLKIFGPP